MTANPVDNTASTTDESTTATPSDENDSIPELEIATVKRENAPSLMTNSALNSNEVRYAPRVMNPEVAFLVRSALMTAISWEPGGSWRGTSARVANEIKRKDIGGKTGTTNWFCWNDRIGIWPTPRLPGFSKWFTRRSAESKNPSSRANQCS